MKVYILILLLLSGSACGADEGLTSVWKAAGFIQTADARAPDGLISLFGSEPDNIRVVSFSPFIGDTIIYYFPILGELRRKYPKAKIEFTSPFSNIVSDKSISTTKVSTPQWSDDELKTILSGDAKEILKLKPVQGLLEIARNSGGKSTLNLQYIYGLKALLYKSLSGRFNFNQLQNYADSRALNSLLNAIFPEYQSQLRRVQATGLVEHVSKHRGGWRFIASNLPEIHVESGHPQQRLVDNWNSKINDVGETLTKVQSTLGGTAYDNYANTIWALTLGQEAIYQVPKDLLHFPIAHKKQWREFLPRTKLPLVVLNFNSGKVQGYENYLRELDPITKQIAQSLKAKGDYEVAYVKLNGPQTDDSGSDFEPEIRKTDKNIQKYLHDQFGNKVHILPSEKDNAPLLNRAIKEAHLVISVDSGFVHIANLLTDPSRVITFSTFNLRQTQSSLWRIKDQSYAELKNLLGNEPETEGLNSAISEAVVRCLEKGILDGVRNSPDLFKRNQ